MSRPCTINSRTGQDFRRQLLPRNDRLRDMINSGLVPKSNQNIVIVQCVQKTLGFKTNQFNANKQYLQNYISRQQFNKFVLQCNKVIEQQIINKTKKQNQSFFWIISTLLKISTVIAILTFFLFSTIVFFQLQDDVTQKILMIAGGLLASASMIAIVCPIILYRSQYETVNQHQIIKERLNKLTEIKNAALIQEDKQHLKWIVQSNYFWLELHIDRNMYKSQKENYSEDIEIKNQEESQNVSAHQFIRKKISNLNQQNLHQFVRDL